MLSESILPSYIDMLNLDCFYNFWVNKRNKYILNNLWRGFLLSCSKFLVYISSSDFASWKLRKRPAVLVLEDASHYLQSVYKPETIPGEIRLRFSSCAKTWSKKKKMLNFLERERINSILLLRRPNLLRGNKFSLNCGGESKVGLKKVLHLLLLVIFVRWHQTY